VEWFEYAPSRSVDVSPEQLRVEAIYIMLCHDVVLEISNNHILTYE